MPESGARKPPVSVTFRPFPGFRRIQGALDYPPDQFCPEFKKSRVSGTCPQMTEKGQNPAEPDSGSSLITVCPGSGFSPESALFRVLPFCQKAEKYSPFCLV